MHVLIFLFAGLLTSGAEASEPRNDIDPVAVLTEYPSGTTFYNLVDYALRSQESYDPDGYITLSRFSINGTVVATYSYAGSFYKCFALDGSPPSSCFDVPSGNTTVTVKLEVQDNDGNWDEVTKIYTIKEHKGRRYFVKDHLGSVRTTVDEQGTAIGYDDYYPFGLTMPGRSSNTGNPNDNYKFTGHELDDEAGLNIYHMNARAMDPVLGRFMQIDPMAANYPGLSPYAYVANNPLAFIDPTGMWIDPASQKEWERQKNRVISKSEWVQKRIDRVTARAEKRGWSESKLNKKLGNLQERAASLSSTIETFGVLENSEQGYSLQSGAGEVGGTSYDPSTGNIVLSFGSTSNFVHEATHAGQFETGNLAFDAISGGSYGHDLFDEVAAYSAEFAYDGSSVKALGASSFSGITAGWVQGITTSTGAKPYARHGLVPVNINSPTSTLRKAYPYAAGAFATWPANYTLKNIANIIYKR